MKIATYNIWNSDRGMPMREKQITEELKKVNAEIFCLQEVKEEVYNNIINEISDYQYNYYHIIDIEHDGLLILSKYPIITKNYINSAIFVTVEKENNTYLIINVHLPSESIIHKEKYIVDINKESKNIESDYAFLVGDFNCSEFSSVHNFLIGERTLLKSDVGRYWYDTAEIYSDITNLKLEKTLNLRTNPRWKGKNVASTSSRVDRIYFRDTFPKPFPEFVSYNLFGKSVNEKSGYCASDHYGVVAEINIT